jgi:tetratricopeptide (TPR) repeat protein
MPSSSQSNYGTACAAARVCLERGPRRATCLMLGAAWAIGLAATLILFSGCQHTTGRDAAIDTYIRGMMAYESGDRDKAMAALETAVAQHDDLTMAHAVLGDLYQEKQQYAKAANQYLAVTRLDPYTGTNFYNLGLMYQMLDRVQDAIASYLRALQLNPRDFLANLNLAAAYLALNKPADALPYAVKATELNDKSAGAFFNLGVAQDGLRKYGDAEKSYRRSAELGDVPDAQMRLARDLIRDERFPEAFSVLDVLTRHHDSAQARKLKGDTLLLRNRYDEAIVEFTRALKLAPRYYPAMNDAGWTLISQYTSGLGLDENKRQAAVAIWRQSVKINPDQPKIQDLIKRYGEKFAE